MQLQINLDFEVLPPTRDAWWWHMMSCLMMALSCLLATLSLAITIRSNGAETHYLAPGDICLSARLRTSAQNWCTCDSH